MPNTYVFQLARNQRILILVTSNRIDLYLSVHVHMDKHICLSMPLCIQLHWWIMHISLYIELVLETLHISLVLVCHSSSLLYGHIYLSLL